MDLFGAYTLLFRTPRWPVYNLLLTSLCMLIPVIGSIVLIGYFGDVLDRRLKGDRETIPEFDFGRFVPYFSRGFPPFLTDLIVGLVGLVVMGVAASPLAAISMFDLRDRTLIAPIAASALLGIAAALAITLVSMPVDLGALLTRDLGAALSPPFVIDFLGRVGWPALGSVVFLLMTAPFVVIVGWYGCCMAGGLIMAGYAGLFIGLSPPITITLAASWDLSFQLYDLYLARVGPSDLT